MSEFLDALAEKESTNNPSAINQYGYLGLWQMGESALVDSGFITNDGQMNNNYQDYTWTPAANALGINKYTDFLNNSNGQLSAIQKYHAKLEIYLRNNGAWAFIGQTVDGVVVTASGLLAAAHLVGAKAVGQWLSSGGNPPADGNGVTAGNYLKRFNNLGFSTDKILVDSDGNTFEIHKEFNADGSLKSETLTDRRANGDYSSETYDKDGNLLSTDKTVTDADGVQKYHTDYDAEGNPTGQKNSFTKKDGSVKYSEKRDADGNLTSTDLTETKKDGSKKETHMEYNPDGTVKSWKIIETAPDGTVTERTPYIPPHEPHDPSLYGPFDSAKSWEPPRRDPLALDLDGDGIETVGSATGVLFDHNSDGIKTGTGWIKSDDGLLVRDLNGNGSIDSGAELFGDGTLLQDGQLATTGFAALGDLDSDKNGKIDAADTAFAELKIWRDLNQDGISQTNELATLADLGIKAVNLSNGVVNQSQTGNIIARNGTFTRIDGTTGTVADINLASNLFTRKFTEQIAVPVGIAALLPNMTGSGKVRDLHEAAALAPALRDILARFSVSTTYSEQMALIDELLVEWADSSGMAASLDERVGSQYRVEYLQIGNIDRAWHLSAGDKGITTSVTNAENPLLDATYRDLIRQWNGRIHVLEAFNGSYFFAIPGQAQEGGGARSGMWTDYTGTTALSEANKNKPGLVISYSQEQLNQLEPSYQALKQSVYASLVLQTRLQGYIDLIGINPATNPVSPDFTRVSQAFQAKIAVDTVNGLADLIEFNKFAGNLLREGYWDGVVLMEDAIRNSPLTPELEQLYRDFDVRMAPLFAGNAKDNIILGSSSQNTLHGYEGNDILLGGAGDEKMTGGTGNDTLSGGAGNDQLFGEMGNDTYIFRRGDGNDLVHDSLGKNSIIFSSLNPDDITVFRSGTDKWSLTFRIKDTGETLTTRLGWQDSNALESHNSNSFFFSDGTIWSRDEAVRHITTTATEGNDIISGTFYDDNIQGLGGNDFIVGNEGDDIIEGGAGNDTLMGLGDFYSTIAEYYGSELKANGNDTYLFGRASGHDTIIDGDATTNADRLKFKDDILPADVRILRTGLDLVLSINGTDDQVTLKKYFEEGGNLTSNGHPYEIEKIEFSDGTAWTAATIKDLLLAGSDTSETLIGYRGDDVITGKGGNDILEGRSGNDLLSGGVGNDIIRGGSGDDLLDGGAGDDYLAGNVNGSGISDGPVAIVTDNDTYLFGWGDGHDTIYDYDWRAGNQETLRFKEGVGSSDVRFERIENSGGDLLVVLGDGADTVTVKNWFGYSTSYFKIERFEFADGTVIDSNYVDTHLTKVGTIGDDHLVKGSRSGETLLGFDGNDTIFGNGGDDIYDGGAGNDVLRGSYGDDTYIFGQGSGRDTVIDYGWSNSDTLAISSGVLPTDITIRRLGNDMILTINGTDDRLVVKDGFNEYSAAYRIEQVRFEGGQTWDYATLQARAMLATAGNDVIEGTSGADLLDGLGGDDTLKGGYGSDTYRFGIGYGKDVIDEGWNYSTDTVEFMAGISAGGLSYAMDKGDLLITVKGTEDSLRIQGGTNVIERFTFTDGLVLTAADIKSIVTMPPDSETLIGTTGADVLVGSDLDSVLLGLAGDDTLIGSGGSDRLEGGEDNDVLIGGSGRDTLNGGAGNNIYRFERGTGLDTVVSRWLQGDEDTVEFGPGITASDLQVQLGGGPRNMEITGTTGYSQLILGIGGDDVFKIAGADWVDISRTSVCRFVFANGEEMSLEDILALSDGGVVGYQWGSYSSDNLIGSNDDDQIYGYNGNDSLRGRGNKDYLYGDRGDDALSGDSGDDSLVGGSGSDILAGGQGVDNLDGGYGNDVYLFNRGNGNDHIENTWDGQDQDTLSFGVGIGTGDISAFVAVGGQLVLLVDGGVGGRISCPLANNQGMLGTESLSLRNVQFVEADGRVRIFDLVGLVREKLASLVSSDDLHPVGLFANAEKFDITSTTLPAGGDKAVAYAQTGDMFAVPLYAATPSGTEGDDIVFGTPDADSLNGRGGNDLIYGLNSDDYLEGGAGRDRLVGGNGSDTIFGGSDNDALFGDAGDDLLAAGPGNDISWGGFGNDTFIFNAGDGRLTIEDSYLEENTTDSYGGDYGGDYGGYYGGDYGGNYGGTITAVNVLQFGPGIAATDLQFSEKDGYLVIDIAATGDQVRLAGYDPERPTYSRAVDIFRFSDGSEVSNDEPLVQGINITGTDGDDSFQGSSGNDILVGGGGSDNYVFNLGDGVDTLVDISVPDMENSITFGAGITADDIRVVIEEGTLFLRVGDGGDAIRFDGFNPTVPGMPPPVAWFYFEDDDNQLSFAELLSDNYEIVGTPEQDILTGTSGNDRIRGLAGNDLLAGGTGDDTYLFVAGDGIDTIYDVAGPGEGNMLVLPDGSAPDHIRLSHDPDSHTLILREMETDNEIRLAGFDRLNPSGSHAVQYYQFGPGGQVLTYDDLIAQGFDIVGTASGDHLLGTSVTDRIHGATGDDTLESGTGNDFLFGEGGDDTFVFNQGDGILTITDMVALGEGNHLKFGPGIEREDLRRHLYFEAPTNGNEGTMIIAFDNGDEVHLVGFNPDDVLNSPRSVDTFQFADGTTLSFAELAAFTFIVEGDGYDNALSGTNLGDRLYGRDGNDTLAAGTGSDVLTGGTGNDGLSGGTGRDVYVLNLGDGADQIVDAAANGVGNSILFGAGIGREDLVLMRDGNTLTIHYGTLGDQVRIENFDPTGMNGSLVIDTFEFNDGSSVSYREFVNHTPAAGDAVLPNATISEDQPFSFQLPKNTFRDVDGDPLLYNAEVSGFTRMPDWLQFDRATGIFSGTPGNDDVGSLTLTVSAFDPLGASAFRSFAVAVANVNDAPLVDEALTGQVATEDQPFTYQIPADTFRDIDAGDTLALSAALANGSPLPAWLSFNAATGTFSGTPDNDQVGTTTVRVTATDQIGAAIDTDLTIEVINVNDAPELAQQEDILLQDVRAIHGQISAIDPDGDLLSYSLSGGPAHGNFLLDKQGAWQYLPNALFIGTDSVVVAVDDGNGGVSSTTLAFDVRVSAPVMADQALLLDEDSGLHGTLPVTNAVGGSLSYQITSNAGHGLFSLDEDGTWSYVPEENFQGEERIQVQATNEYGLASTASLILMVASVNDVPSVISEERFVLLGIPALGGRIEAGDVDGDPLRYALSGAPVHGAMTISEQGWWQYTPANGFYGEDHAEVTISDGAGGKAKTTLCFVVNTYEDGDLALPEKTSDTLYLKDIGKADLTFDKDGDTLTIEIRRHGTIRVNGYFSTPDKGLKTIETSDGQVNLAKDYIVDAGNWCSLLNGAIHGLLGDQLLVSGTACSDTLLGAMKSDVVFGSASGDYIFGLAGDDLLVGGTGNDSLYGNDGNDTVYGDQGADGLSGGTGNDFLVGGNDKDQLFGDAGNDHLVGGLGNDILTGGTGNDRFVFDSILNATTNRDVILDFTSGQDKIELSKDIFSALSEKGSLASCSFHVSASGIAVDDNDYILYNTTSGALLYDLDGNGQGVAIEFTTLSQKPTIKAEDFLIAS